MYWRTSARTHSIQRGHSPEIDALRSTFLVFVFKSSTFHSLFGLIFCDKTKHFLLYYVLLRVNLVLITRSPTKCRLYRFSCSDKRFLIQASFHIPPALRKFLKGSHIGLPRQQWHRPDPDPEEIVFCDALKLFILCFRVYCEFNFV